MCLRLSEVGQLKYFVKWENKPWFILVTDQGALHEKRFYFCTKWCRWKKKKLVNGSSSGVCSSSRTITVITYSHDVFNPILRDRVKWVRYINCEEAFFVLWFFAELQASFPTQRFALQLCGTATRNSCVPIKKHHAQANKWTCDFYTCLLLTSALNGYILSFIILFLSQGLPASGTIPSSLIMKFLFWHIRKTNPV